MWANLKQEQHNKNQCLQIYINPTQGLKNFMFKTKFGKTKGPAAISDN